MNDHGRFADCKTGEQVSGYISMARREMMESSARRLFDGQLNRNLWNYIGRANESQPVTEFFDHQAGVNYVYPSVVDDRGRITMNRIQNIVVAMMSVQASEPPRLTLLPRDYGDEPLAFLNTDHPRAAELLSAFPQIMPSAALDPQLASAIRAEIQRQKLDPANPNPLPDDILIEVNNNAVAQAMQIILDAWWEAANGNLVFLENALNKCVFGWQPTVYWFDRDYGHPVLRNPNVRHVFVDCIHTDPQHREMALWDELVSLDEACERYPGSERLLYLSASQRPEYPDGIRYGESAQYDQQFMRPMVILRHFWMARQPVPMEPEEAVEMGRVIRTTTVTDAGQEESLWLPDGTRVSPGDAAWPRKYGVRYVCLCSGGVLHDGPSPYPIIPLAENVNTPIPNSPYGQGEPERLNTMQEALDRVLTANVQWHEYNAFPVEVTTSDINDRMEASMRNARVKPGERLVIPQDIVDQVAALTGGDLSKLYFYLQAPAIGADSWRLLEFLIESIDREGQHAEVLQGQSPANRSGLAISQLTSNATAAIRIKSQRSEHYLRHLARLFVTDIARLSLAEARRWCSRWPDAVFAAIHSRFRAVTMDVRVEIRSASGATKTNRIESLIRAKAVGVPVPVDEILSNMEIDPELARRQAVEEMKLRQMAEPPPPRPVPEAQAV